MAREQEPLSWYSIIEWFRRKGESESVVCMENPRSEEI